MGMHDFDVVLDTDWLREHTKTIDSFTRKMIIGAIKNSEFVYQGSWFKNVNNYYL